MNDRRDKNNRPFIVDVSRFTANIIAALVITFLIWIAHSITQNTEAVSKVGDAVINLNKVLSIRIGDDERRINALENEGKR